MIATTYDTIRYDTRCYFNVRSKANTSQLNLPHTRISHTGYVLWADETRRTRLIGYLHYSFPINGVWPNHLHVYIYTHTHIHLTALFPGLPM